MRYSDTIGFALQDIKRRKKRIALTSFGITLGAILIILMVSLGMLMNQFMLNTVNSGGNTKSIEVNYLRADVDMEKDSREMMENTPRWMKRNFKKIDNGALRKLSSIENVDGIKAYIDVQVAEVILGGSEHYGTFDIRGYNNDYDTWFQSELSNARSSSKDSELEPIIEGRALSKDDRNGVLVGESLLDELGIKKPKDIVGRYITVNIGNINGNPVQPFKLKLRVEGVVSKHMADGSRLVMSSENAAKVAGFLQYTDRFFQKYGYSGTVIEGRKIDDLNSIVDGVKEIGYYAESPDSKTEKINESFKDINFVLAILGVIVIFVAGIGIINTMIMAVHERRKSIGIMKAVGAGNSDIKGIFIAQSAAIGLIGSVIGTVIASLLFRVISGVVIQKLLKTGNSVELMRSVPIKLMVATILFSVVISVLAGLYPSKKASELDPVEALRE